MPDFPTFSWVGLSDFSWPKNWRNKPGFSDKTVINIRISHFSLYGNRITVLIGLMYHRFSGVCHIDATSYRFSAAWFGSDTHFVGKWVGWDVISWSMSIIVCCDTQEAQLSQRNRATRYVSWNFITLLYCISFKFIQDHQKWGDLTLNAPVSGYTCMGRPILSLHGNTPWWPGISRPGREKTRLLELLSGIV